MGDRYYGNLIVRGSDDFLTLFDLQFRKAHTEIQHDMCRIEESEFCLDSFDPELYALKNNYVAARAVKVVYDDDRAPEDSGIIRINYIISETTGAGYSFQNFIPVTREDILSTCNSAFFSQAVWDAWGCNKYLVEKKTYCETSNELSYELFTKNGIPFTVFEAMSQQFPNLDIIFNFEADFSLAGHISLRGGEYLHEDYIRLEKDESYSDEWYQKKYKFLQKHKIEHYTGYLVSCHNCDALKPLRCLMSEVGVECPTCNKDIFCKETFEESSDIISKKPIRDVLRLTDKSHSRLKRAGKETFGDLLQMTDEDFCKIWNIDQKDIETVGDFLQMTDEDFLKNWDPDRKDIATIKNSIVKFKGLKREQEKQ